MDVLTLIQATVEPSGKNAWEELADQLKPLRGNRNIVGSVTVLDKGVIVQTYLRYDDDYLRIEIGPVGSRADRYGFIARKGNSRRATTCLRAFPSAHDARKYLLEFLRGANTIYRTFEDSWAALNSGVNAWIEVSA